MSTPISPTPVHPVNQPVTPSMPPSTVEPTPSSQPAPSPVSSHQHQPAPSKPLTFPGPTATAATTDDLSMDELLLLRNVCNSRSNFAIGKQRSCTQRKSEWIRTAQGHEERGSWIRWNFARSRKSPLKFGHWTLKKTQKMLGRTSNGWKRKATKHEADFKTRLTRYSTLCGWLFTWLTFVSYFDIFFLFAGCTILNSIKIFWSTSMSGAVYTITGRPLCSTILRLNLVPRTRARLAYCVLCNELLSRVCQLPQ